VTLAKRDKRLSGIIPIVPTPFTDVGEVDLPSLRRTVDYLLGAGVHGLAVLGVASEVYSLTDAERGAVIEAAVEQVAGRLPVLAGSSHNSAEAAASTARDAVKAGADVLLVMPPFFVKPTAGALANYYRAIAAAVDVPIMIQDNPGWTGVAFPVETYRELADVPSIAYAKIEVPHPPTKIREVRRALGDRYIILGGQAGNFFLEELSAGVVGTMPASIMPHVYVRVWEEWRAGKQAEARALFNRYHPAIRVTAQQTVGFAMVKHLLWVLGIIASPRVRNPLQPLSTADQDDLEAVVRELDLLTVMREGLGASGHTA
jgi:2-keto-3-deoxy-L-arabinonate dehydratase